MEKGLLILTAIVATAALIVFSRRRKRRGRPRLLLELKFDNQLKVRGHIMAITLTSTQFVEGVLQPVDSRGRPAPVDENSVEFTSSNPEVFVVEVDPDDHLRVKVIAIGQGVAELRYSADADLGEGVVTIEGFTAIEVVGSMAAGFAIVFGEPQEQPEGTSSTTTSTTSTEGF